jgi:acetyl esterase/lipase
MNCPTGSLADRLASAFITACIVLVPLVSDAQPAVSLKLWPHGAPGTPTTREPETNVSRPDLNGTRGAINRVTNITDPTLTVYPPANKNSGAAIVVFPGGGYRWLSMDIEGSEVCPFFNRAGLTCIVAKYRVPQPDQHSRYEQPLQDAQRALGIVRLHAKEWNIDPARVGVIGFSAGAHLSAVLSNNFQKRTYPPIDDADQQSCRPDFAVVMYPGYLTSREPVESIAPEVTPTRETPPTFLFQAENDSVRVENSVIYYTALKGAKVPAEMHLYAEGGHGYGMRTQATPIAGLWPDLVLKWLETIKMLPPNTSTH